ncbi:prephenate dehydrogenase/arogenate dehydrogenase family protein [Desulfovibrio sp. OH1186_COT-070]|nr:prephenate dehydrogenase/arogenate dehydrogenase family protein [Desulfovibrio sp. OH1209_COT-279]RRD86564.1 prephenate dehydrogenase/arogenate dehydrogenase family protein [Desulfovibrio sp. OH1186_COT-070]
MGKTDMLNSTRADACKDLPSATLIVGARGRMGGMLLAQARDAGLDVRGVDTELTSTTLAQACADVELALLCVPAPVLEQVALQVCSFLPHTAVLADITSVKEGPLRQMEKVWPGAVVGSHPLFGPQPETTADRPVVIVPGARAEKRHLALTENFFTLLGCQVFRSDAATHDKAMARIQNMNFITNLTYFAMLAGEDDLLPFLTPSFRRRLHAARKMLTEDARLFADLFEANAHSHEAVRQYRNMLNLAAAGDVDLLCRRAQWWWNNGQEEAD